MPAERLQKVLAAAGIGSRRQAEKLIAEGRVTVDGRVARLGETIDPDTVAIAVDDRPIGEAAQKVYLALHKPAGVTSTVADPHAEQTVLDLVPTALRPSGGRVFPVGRLDVDSEGLLLLTNDGDWADHVLHPRYEVEREYAVGLAEPLADRQALALEDGIELDEGVALVLDLRIASSTVVRRLGELLEPSPSRDLAWYQVVIRTGWKRQVRRMFGAVRAPVVRLVRIRIGTVKLDIASGSVRPLRAPEVSALVEGTAIRSSSRRSADRRAARRPAGGPRGPRPAREPRHPGSRRRSSS
jgi:pseudouridine synthase